MSTVKEVIDAFCYRVNIPAHSSYVGSTAPAQAQYLSLLKFVGDKLRNMPYDWPQLKREYTFNTETGVRDYQLPGDFYRALNSTQWDVTNQWPMRGPITDFNYSLREFAVVSLQTRKAYRLTGPTQYLYNTSPYNQRSAGYFSIDPAGQNDTDELYMQYVGASWVWPRDWVTATAYTAGDLRSGVGQIYRAAGSGTSGATRPAWQSGSDSDGTVSWAVYKEPYTWLNDADLVLFDDDLMIEGMRWAYLRAKGLEYTTERQDWENNVRSSFARFNGPTRINASDEFGAYFDWPNVPAGDWNV